MRNGGNSFTTVRVEGAILPPDLLQRVVRGDAGLDGLKPVSYHLIEGEKLNEATNRSWNRLVGAWAAFRAAVGKLPNSDPATSVTRERWLLPLFQELGYGRLTAARAIEIEDRSYAISHQWNSAPIHLIGCGVGLDVRTEGVAGAARMSPHGMLQELLNRSDKHLWGFLSNGLRLRILRDNSSLTRQAFVEFDLEAMMDGEVYSDFVLLWLLCHESRVEAERLEECWLEKWSRAAQEQGTRALDQLRNGVEQAISALGAGFLSHPANAELRERLRDAQLDAQDYYRQLLRLVYRMLFLFAAEDRELLLAPDAGKEAKDRYTRFYSTARIRRLAGRRRGTRHADLFYGLRLVMQKLGSDQGCPELGLPALGSFLFSHEATRDIDGCQISNGDFLDAVRALAFTVDRNVRRPVDYKNLGSEELGSVYESLLELHPELNLDAATFALRTAGGNERKTTGSYYTPSSLIQCLLDSALDPVIDEAVKKPDPEKALLDLKVCDPACGSGHFLIAAAHRIAKRLAAVRTGDEEPSPDATRHALREVIARCIYGVDINPMSVELCKVALWMEAIDPGKPLSFLDHHIQCGNSLIGATPRLLKEGIPDAAFDSIEGDDKAVCAEYKKRNREFRKKRQESLFDDAGQPWERLGDLATAMVDLGAADDGTIAGEHRKQEQYERFVRSSQYEFGRLLADTWCAAFMWKKTREFDYPITEEVFRRIERTPHATPDWMRTEVRRLSKQYQFFHWHIAFPDVFRVPGADEEPENEQTGWTGGFDCVLGNPPWERLQFEEQDFLAGPRPDIAAIANQSSRRSAVATLATDDPVLFSSYTESKRLVDASAALMRAGGCYPLTAVDKFNLYAVFAELSAGIHGRNGRAGIIVKAGLITDKLCSAFFSDLLSHQRLVRAIEFENREGLFPTVHPQERFALVTFGFGAGQCVFCFDNLTVDQSRDSDRYITMGHTDVMKFSPNTGNCPKFCSRQDYAITRQCYAGYPVLVRHAPLQDNPWSASVDRYINVSDFSDEIATATGIGSPDGYLPLYEGKLFIGYDHRFGSYASGEETVPVPDRAPDRRIEFLRHIPEEIALRRNPRLADRGAFLCARDITNRTNERGVIAAIIPAHITDYTVRVVQLDGGCMDSAYLLTAFNSLVFDFLARQCIGGTHLSSYVLEQLPVPTRDHLSPGRAWLVPQALELTYTGWDIRAFADDVWKEADDTLREAIVRQWEENRAATGGHEWDPPEWAEIDEDGIKLPPFKWDEDRRALLRAELDAYYAKLYGLNRKQLRYILDPHGLSKRELEDILDPWEDPTCSGPHLLPEHPALDFPGETFRVLKDKEEKQFGEYRTRRLVLEAWERLHREGLMPEAYDQRNAGTDGFYRAVEALYPWSARFDGYAFQEATGFDPWPIRDAYFRGEQPRISIDEKMALFFFIERNWKWGTDGHISQEDWDLYRRLFFELCEEDVNPRYRHPELYREWQESSRPRLAEVRELVQRAHPPERGLTGVGDHATR